MFSWRTLLSAVALSAATPGCSGEIATGVPEETSPTGNLCSRACQRRVQGGCATDPASCAETCELARGAGYCKKELDTHLACVAEADDLRCGRAPNGGSCDTEGAALERCIVGHAVDDPPLDCYESCA